MGYGLYGFDYDQHAKFVAIHEIDRLKKTEEGLFVMCEARERNTTRLYIHRFNDFATSLNKDGWWDTFTISKTACKETGIYICQIDTFQIDKNGYLNMIVTPKKYLNDIEGNDDEDSDAWIFLFRSSKFTQEYRTRSYSKGRYNVVNMYKTFENEYNKIVEEDTNSVDHNCISSDRKFAGYILNKFFDGDITIKEIEKILDEKDDLEKLADDLSDELHYMGDGINNKYFSKYPLTVAKIPKQEGYIRPEFYSSSVILDYLKRKISENLELGLSNPNTEPLDMVEAVLKYWNNKKIKEKEERKKKRLENKGSNK